MTFGLHGLLCQIYHVNPAQLGGWPTPQNSPSGRALQVILGGEQAKTSLGSSQVEVRDLDNPWDISTVEPSIEFPSVFPYQVHTSTFDLVL